MTHPKGSRKAPMASPPGGKSFLFFIIILAIGGLAVAVWLFPENTPNPPFRYDDAGQPQLQPDRLKKMEKELDKLDEAEQYALVATTAGWYACFNCPDTTHIYLFPGQIWKYGVTVNGPDRYPRSFYKENKLQYISQFKGTLQECLREEKRKIYHYPILPENVKRKKPILRPPGNKKDS
ncbi:MAG: hypothetical protein KDC75_24920 [Phaeodactylibacter sp.]|nr:hypothetical protein [Phaeodactylibacter sp.]